MPKSNQLSRRERQIMDVLYRLEKANVAEIMENLPDALSNSTVRTVLRKLEEKGHVGHEEKGLKYVYFPTVDPQKASQTALSSLVKTFFKGSPFLAVNSLLDLPDNDISDEELERLKELIRKKENKNK